MKREYGKPMIFFEELTLDMPIATGCEPAVAADVETLEMFGYFTGDRNCGTIWEDGTMIGDNKMCVYTNVTHAYSS